MLLPHYLSWCNSDWGREKKIQEDHGGDHRHRSRSGRLSFLHSAKFGNNFSATSRKEVRWLRHLLIQQLCGAAEFSWRMRNSANLLEVSQSVSCRWSGRSFCVAVLELRPPAGLQSLSRDESRGRSWSRSLHNAHSWALSPIYYLEIWSVSPQSLAGGVTRLRRGSSSPVAGRLSVCPSVCLFVCA